MKSHIRTRWAALGAAVAVTVGGGGLGLVGAAVSSSERAVFIPITPCRLVDTRAGSGVLPRNTPFGSGEIYTINAHGDNGQCRDIPADATALSLNVTSLAASTLTYFTFWPTGTLQPNASSLNPAPGQPPTPNAVITDISPAGQFNIFNERGTIGAIIDINGYYVDHNHDDRYYTEAEVAARVDAAKSITVYAGGEQNLPLTSTAAVYRTVTIVPPVGGKVIATSSGYVLSPTTSAYVARCSISTTPFLQGQAIQYAEPGGGFYLSEVISGVRGFDVVAGVPLTVNFVCDVVLGAARLNNSWLTATFTPG